MFAKIEQAFTQLAARPKPAWISSIIRFLVMKLVPSSFSVKGVIYHPNPSDYILTGHLFLGIYENAERQIFEALCDVGDDVLDLGGNIGIFSGIAARKVGTTGKVVVFEPEPHNADCLQKMQTLNGFQNIQIERKAVADCASTFRLYLSSVNMGDHRLEPAEEDRKSIEIETVALDEYLPDYTPLVIKMDIQGAEARACKGMERMLQRMPEGAVLMEYWPYGLRRAGANPTEVLDAFANRGFKGLVVDTSTRRLSQLDRQRLSKLELEYDAVNILFMKGDAYQLQTRKKLSRFCTFG